MYIVRQIDAIVTVYKCTDVFLCRPVVLVDEEAFFDFFLHPCFTGAEGNMSVFPYHLPFGTQMFDTTVNC